MKRLIMTCLVSLLLPMSVVAADNPNIIVIMADDLGYGDVSCNGSKTIATPNMDRLAAEGIRFTSGYCSASTCTPTRFSLLTGTYAFREKGTGVAPPNAPAIIRPGTPTIASMLKQRGYVLGEPGSKGRDYLVQQDNAGKRFGLRAGPWKLVRQPNGGNREKAREGGLTESLYHLADDPSEQRDLAEQNPEQLQRMRKILDQAIRSDRTRDASSPEN